MRALSILILLLFTASVFAQEADKKKKKEENLPPEASTFQVQLHQDNGFGFYPKIKASIGIDYNKSFTINASMFTNPALAAGANNPVRGADLWLETGVGFSTSFFKKTLFINPSLNLVSGKYLNGKSSLLVEGVAPSIHLTYQKKAFDLEVLGTAYFNLRNFSSGGNTDYVWVQLYPGLKINKWLTIGAHYEEFREVHPADLNMYRWAGGFLKFTIGEKYSMRFMGGKNFNNNKLYAEEYYRFSTIIPLM
jgi:hypothetical protein